MKKLNELKKLVEEKEEIKKAIVEEIGRFCNIIADYCDEGTEICVGNRFLWIEKHSSNIGSSKFLTIGGNSPGIVTNSTPGSTIFLHGDFNTPLYIADIEEFCWVGEHAQQILEELIEEVKKEKTKLKKTLEKFLKGLNKVTNQLE